MVDPRLLPVKWLGREDGGGSEGSVRAGVTNQQNHRAGAALGAFGTWHRSTRILPKRGSQGRSNSSPQSHPTPKATCINGLRSVKCSAGWDLQRPSLSLAHSHFGEAGHLANGKGDLASEVVPV